MNSSAAQCAFCGRSGVKMSNEHVFPKWLSKAGLSVVDEYVMNRMGKVTRSKIMQLKTRRVCEDCNTGWMCRIENSTIPIMTPLLEGTVNRITEIDRWIISRWFMKTILTAQLALTARDRTGPLHPTDYETFFAFAQPFHNQFTLIAGYTGKVLPITFAIYSPNEATNQGVRALLHFHRVILMTFLMRMDGGLAVMQLPGGNFIDAVHMLWPTQRELGPFNTGDPTMALPWPPPVLVNEPTVETLLEVLQHPSKPGTV
jgi:hypothetical protein